MLNDLSGSPNGPIMRKCSWPQHIVNYFTIWKLAKIVGRTDEPLVAQLLDGWTQAMTPVTNALNVLQACFHKSVKQGYF